MKLLNIVCYGSTTLMFGLILIFDFFLFCTSFYSCFTKKVEGKLIGKIFITLVTGFACPWLFKLMLMFFKMIEL